jgi:hypothetical protein
MALWGNAWRIAKGHSLVLELTQSDTPTFRRDNFPTSATIGAISLHVPRAVAAARNDFRD